MSHNLCVLSKHTEVFKQYFALVERIYEPHLLENLIGWDRQAVTSSTEFLSDIHPPVLPISPDGGAHNQVEPPVR